MDGIRVTPKEDETYDGCSHTIPHIACLDPGITIIDHIPSDPRTNSLHAINNIVYKAIRRLIMVSILRFFYLRKKIKN